MKRLSFSIILGLLFCVAPSVHAQVTIGLGTAPNAGALLDLKNQNVDPITNANATKGLGMPRVALTAVNKLQPMYSYADATAANTPDATAKDAHIGLWLYNTNECLVPRYDGNASGLYVWDGTLWQGITKTDAVLPTATPTETSAASNTWGTNVIRHQAKANAAVPGTNIYEEFTSAYFGTTAGRWMTTNLAAKAYDGIQHSTDLLSTATTGVGDTRTLSGPNGNVQSVYNSAYWAYPNTPEAGPMNATEYSKNKSLGYLYTWDAATAGKGGSRGHDGGNEVGDSHAASNPQGICPFGWHLPSDYEWIVLENEIIQHTSLYSSMADLDPSNPTHLAQNTGETTIWRGTTDDTPYHGTAMKEFCQTRFSNNPESDDPQGKSKSKSQGGFSAPLSGKVVDGSGNNFGRHAYFWSSSSSSPDYAWSRSLYSTQGGVHEYTNARSLMLSVRCKKD